MDVKEEVRKTYRLAALEVAAAGPGSGSCSDASSCCRCSPITGNLYDSAQTGSLPQAAVAASLGCGNPTALADLRPGETVLDLGSGGGIDVLLSARRVSPGGKAYGLDMTDEMLELARANQIRAGVENAEFIKGNIEHIPLPGNTVDVVLSNCVINLSGDKEAVLREAFRVLRPGGRLAVSDVISRGEIPGEIRNNLLLWAGCIAGALDEDAYRGHLQRAGFVDVAIKPTRIYHAGDLLAMFAEKGLDVRGIAPRIDGKFYSGFIRARKP